VSTAEEREEENKEEEEEEEEEGGGGFLALRMVIQLDLLKRKYVRLWIRHWKWLFHQG